MHMRPLCSRIVAMLVVCFASQSASAYYNPSTGQFLSRDPIGERGGINIRNFCHSDPVNRIDFLGMDDYAEGPPNDPKRHWDNGFAYNPDAQATASDCYNWYKYGTLLFGAEFLGRLPDASRAYAHYRDATGTDLMIDYNKTYRDDSEVKKGVDNEIIAAQTIAEAIAKKKGGGSPVTFEIYSRAIRLVNCSTENWQKSIGGHDLWGDGTVTYDPCKKKFVMQLRMKAEDFYNFNKGQADIATGLPDDENGRFEVLGWAKSFFSKGEIQRKVEWDEGKIPDTTVIDGTDRRTRRRLGS